MTEREIPHLPITEDWLREVGFKWHQFDLQPTKHWLLWLGDAAGRGDHEDLGIELTSNVPTDKTAWFCWLRADTAHLYSRFLHVRHLRFQHEVIALIEGLVGQKWDSTNHLYGSLRTPEQAKRIRESHERLDQRWMREGRPWREIEKDDSRGRALPEHMEAAEKARKPNG